MKVLSKNSVMGICYKKDSNTLGYDYSDHILSVISPSFFRGQNLLNIIKQASITGVIGVGMTFVLITGGIDLFHQICNVVIGNNGCICFAEKNMPVTLVLVGSRTWGAVRT